MAKPISVQKSIKGYWYAVVSKPGRNGQRRHHTIRRDTHEQALKAAYDKLKEGQ